MIEPEPKETTEEIEEVEEVEEVEEETPKEIEETEEEIKEEPKKEIKKEEPKKEIKKESSAKEKAASKIVKKIDDKARYDDAAQTKTLIVMQILGNTKSFFDTQNKILDVEGFFTKETLPDTMLPNNNIAQYLMFGGSDGLMDQMIDSQYE